MCMGAKQAKTANSTLRQFVLSFSLFPTDEMHTDPEIRQSYATGNRPDRDLCDRDDGKPNSLIGLLIGRSVTSHGQQRVEGGAENNN